MIIHVEASASDVVVVFASFRRGLVFSFGDGSLWVLVNEGRLILGVVPGDVAVSVVGVDDLGR